MTTAANDEQPVAGGGQTGSGADAAKATAGEQSSNRYNTEVVKFDATSAAMKPNGDLARQLPRQESKGNAAASSDEEKVAADNFALVSSDYELVEHLIPTDSVNVIVAHVPKPSS